MQRTPPCLPVSLPYCSYSDCLCHSKSFATCHTEPLASCHSERSEESRKAMLCRAMGLPGLASNAGNEAYWRDKTGTGRERKGGTSFEIVRRTRVLISIFLLPHNDES